jgi:hypothetical protein
MNHLVFVVAVVVVAAAIIIFSLRAISEPSKS